MLAPSCGRALRSSKAVGLGRLLCGLASATPGSAQAEHGLGVPADSLWRLPPVDMPPQGPPKFDFPIMAVALDVEATGTRLGKDKVVAAGAAVMCVESPDSDVETLATTKVKFQVDYPGDFEPRCLAQFWDAPPTNRRAANDEGDAAESLLPLSQTLLPALQEDALPQRDAALAFHTWWVDVCERFPGFYLISDNPVLDVGMMDIALHRANAPDFGSLAQRPDGRLYLPLDITSLACGLIPYGGAPGRFQTAGTRWSRMHHVLNYDTRTQCPFDYGAHDPLEDAQRNGWLFLESMKLVYARGMRGRGRTGSGGDFLAPRPGSGPAGGRSMRGGGMRRPPF